MILVFKGKVNILPSLFKNKEIDIFLKMRSNHKALQIQNVRTSKENHIVIKTITRTQRISSPQYLFPLIDATFTLISPTDTIMDIDFVGPAKILPTIIATPDAMGSMREPNSIGLSISKEKPKTYQDYTFIKTSKINDNDNVVVIYNNEETEEINPDTELFVRIVV